jgi:hypothetical protein
VAQGEIPVEQPPVVSIPEATPPVESTGTVSLSSGGAPAVLLINEQRSNYDVPSAPAAVQVKLPVGQVILRLQYADGTQSVRRVVIIEQGLTKEVVIMSPLAVRSTSTPSNDLRYFIQVTSADAGQLVVDGAVSSLAVASNTPRTLGYTPQNGRYDITLQIKYPDGAFSDKAPVRVVSGQTVSVTIPPRLYSNRPQGLINLNPQSLATFNPSLVAGRQVAVVGSAVNNRGSGTVSIVSDADGFLCNTTNTSQRVTISANKPYDVTLPPQTISFTVLYPDGTMAPAKSVTIASGQTQTLTFSKPSGLFSGRTAVNNQPAASGGLSFSEIMRLAANSTPAANTGVATISVTSDADARLNGGTFGADITANKPYITSLVPQTLTLFLTYRDGTTSAPQTVTLVGGQTKSVTFRKSASVSSGIKQNYSTLADRPPNYLQQQISGIGSK